MKAFIINLIVIFLVKVIDNVLSTSKVILVQKNRAFLASLTVVISQIIFYKLIDAASSGGDIAVYVISIASGIGTLLALVISNKFSKDRIYVNVIMNDDKKIMMELRDFLKEHKITDIKQKFEDIAEEKEEENVEVKNDLFSEFSKKFKDLIMDLR